MLDLLRNFDPRLPRFVFTLQGRRASARLDIGGKPVDVRVWHKADEVHRGFDVDE
ncbi:MAG: hypothetical protein WAN73_02465 [Methyloceanibacter sp.]